jgi:hypothetical protein
MRCKGISCLDMFNQEVKVLFTSCIKRLRHIAIRCIIRTIIRQTIIRRTTIEQTIVRRTIIGRTIIRQTIVRRIIIRQSIIRRVLIQDALMQFKFKEVII